MSRTAYVNGAYVPHAQAYVHIEDRGYQFADAIYEYIAFYNRRFLDADLHLARLRRSLEELAISFPMSDAALKLVMQELLARNTRAHGGLYMQISRGVARRDHPFPACVKPALIMTISGPKTPKASEVEKGVSVITLPDNRWGRCNIKSVGLLPNVLAKQEASKAKAREAWLIKADGTVTEGAVSNAFIVLEKEGVITHPADAHILSGITRNMVLQLAQENTIAVTERPFTLAEVAQASEAFLTSTSANVLPVVKVENTVIGNGKPGTITQRLLNLYQTHIYKQTGYDAW